MLVASFGCLCHSAGRTADQALKRSLEWVVSAQVNVVVIIERKGCSRELGDVPKYAPRTRT